MRGKFENQNKAVVTAIFKTNRNKFSSFLNINCHDSPHLVSSKFYQIVGEKDSGQFDIQGKEFSYVCVTTCTYHMFHMR